MALRTLRLRAYRVSMVLTFRHARNYFSSSTKRISPSKLQSLDFFKWLVLSLAPWSTYTPSMIIQTTRYHRLANQTWILSFKASHHGRWVARLVERGFFSSKHLHVSWSVSIQQGSLSRSPSGPTLATGIMYYFNRTIRMREDEFHKTRLVCISLHLVDALSQSDCIFCG